MITLTKGTLSIQLRSPEFGNTDALEIRRINRKTRGGDILVFRDPQWPKTRTFQLKFQFLKEDDLSRLLNFMHVTLGQIVTFVDHEGRSWNGIIITPTDEVSVPGRNNFAAQFSFQVQL